MAQGTLWLQPIQSVFKGGIFVPSAKAYFYLAGTSTPTNVYSDVGLTTPITQPVVADASNGAFQEIFLTPGTAYKVDVQTAAGVSLQGYPADNQLAIPGSAATLDQTETAGETLTAGIGAYLSDGSGGKNAGQLYKWDSGNAYSSSLPMIGMVPNAITSGATGTFRVAGQVTGLSALSPGVDYYAGLAGALTATPAVNARYIGRADGTTTLIISPNPPPNFYSPMIRASVITPAGTGIGYGVCGGRLTLTTAVPVTTADVTGATTIYFTPYSTTGMAIGNLGLYDGTTNWTILPFVEISIALGTLTSGLPYDLFAYNNAGVVALRAPVAWTSTTARATALILQNGVWVKTGATTDRYLGTFYTTSTTATADAVLTRYLWNYYNRVHRPMRVTDATAGWTYSTATYQQANASTANQVQGVIGIADAVLDLTVNHMAGENAGVVSVNTAIGEDSTTTADALFIGGGGSTGGGGGWVGSGNLFGRLVKYPAIGQHKWVWLEKAQASGTTTWGSGAPVAPVGLSGWIAG